MYKTEDKMFSKLQNGSDIRGIACDGVEGEKVNLTPEICFFIAKSFVDWLSKKCKKNPESLKIGVGRDSRITGENLASAVISGLCDCGAMAIDCEMATTPAMFMSTIFSETNFDGSIMITASHLPFNRNGLKFFDKDGGLEKGDIKSILEKAEEISRLSRNDEWRSRKNDGKSQNDTENTQIEVERSQNDGENYQNDRDLESSCEKFDLISLYANYLLKAIRDGISKNGKAEKPLSGLKIVLDAGNGAGGFFATKILAELGADTTGSQFLNPDGMFPNHIPNPENSEAMKSIQSAVLKNHADLGLIFDTDVDRMSAVFPDGTEVNRDSVIALMAAILASEYPNSTIVTDSVTSDRLTRFLENELGLKHHPFKRGYKNVINECKRLNESGIISPLAMETSGHGALKDNFYLDDGAFLAVKIIIALAKAKSQGKKLENLIEKLEPLVEAKEIRFKIKTNDETEDFSSYGDKVLAEFKNRAENQGLNVQKSYEGVRISFQDKEKKGWLLLRKSLHEPVMPLNIEGEQKGDSEKIFEIAKNLLFGFDRLGNS